MVTSVRTSLGLAIACVLCVTIYLRPLVAADPTPTTQSEYNATELKKGEYAFSVKTQVNGEDARFNGTFSFKGVLQRQLKPLREDLAADLSTTAFAINNRGQFITSSKIAFYHDAIYMHLDGTMYPARVVAYDDYLQVAVVEIEGLATKGLALGDSHSVAAGDRLTACGFVPVALSKGKGKPPTPKEGTTSVFQVVQKDEVRLIQASLLSEEIEIGSPLIDRNGKIVGMLARGAVTADLKACYSVSTGADSIRKWLVESGFEIADAATAPRIAADSISKSAAPSIANLFFPILPHTGTKSTLRLTAFTSFSFDSKIMGDLAIELPSQTGGSVTPGKPKVEKKNVAGKQVINVRDSLAFDSLGRDIHSEDWEQTPLLLCPIATFATKRLPIEDTTSWQTKANYLYRTNEGELTPSSDHDFSYLFVQHRLSEYSTKAPSRIGHYRESTDYQVDEKTEDAMVITMKHKANIDWCVGQRGTEKLTGEGKYVFDRKLGVIREASFGGQYEATKGESKMEIPVSVTIKRQPSE